MKVYFLRHGVAADPEKWEGTDFDRPLTGDGRERMARQSKALAKLSLEPDLIVTSPLLRAKQTASIVAEGLKLHEKVVEDERLGLGFDSNRLAGILQEHKDSGALMLVGHEPGMSETIGRLIGHAKVDLKKGALACVNVPDLASLEGELLSLIPAKVLLL
jgi:phosphohistidine phosphatase